eukprot:gene658-8159_t
MFPYPSGSIHMGHVRVYAISDLISRWKKLSGYEVLHPMGFDAFGLPAENAAIERNIKASEWTYSNIDYMRNQLKMIDLDFDWSKEIITCSPEYYKWTQWIFLQLYKHGYAYKKLAEVNWDPVDNTVLANEQVDANGKSWRSGATVEKKNLNQWFFNIRHFAKELLNTEDLDQWPENVKKMQENWIGESKGCLIYFKLQNEIIQIYTTRAETIYGVTYLAISKDHPLVKGNQKEGEYYTGIDVIHPLTNSKIPVFVADYVISEFGEGCVMGVPSSDERDFQFATKHNIPMIKVLDTKSECYTEAEGKIINSEEFNGMECLEAREAIIKHLEKIKMGKSKTEFRIRDWLISRQRHWGAPIPMVDCPECGILPVKEESLPILLDSDLNMECPCGKGVKCKRETDTMDTFVDSSWYFLRFIDPLNSEKIFDSQLINKWMNVDVYVGGIEHAVLHLLYARFIHKFLHSIDLFKGPKEPFNKLLTQGMVLGKSLKNKNTNKYYVKKEDFKEINGEFFDVKTNEKLDLVWEKMSKSKGNGVDPEAMINQYGADAIRLYILFKAPVEKDLEWDESQVIGQLRFLKKLETLIENSTEKIEKESKNDFNFLIQNLNEIIKSINHNLNNFEINICVSQFHKYVNLIWEEKETKFMNDLELKEYLEKLLILMFPFTPSFSRRMFGKLTEKKIEDCEFPQFNENIKKAEIKNLVIQVNGKFKGMLKIPTDLSNDEVLELVKNSEIFKKLKLNLNEIRKTIQVSKVFNFVTK